MNKELPRASHAYKYLARISELISGHPPTLTVLWLHCVLFFPVLQTCHHKVYTCCNMWLSFYTTVLPMVSSPHQVLFSLKCHLLRQAFPDNSIWSALLSC